MDAKTKSDVEHDLREMFEAGLLACDVVRRDKLNPLIIEAESLRDDPNVSEVARKSIYFQFLVGAALIGEVLGGIRVIFKDDEADLEGIFRSQVWDKIEAYQRVSIDNRAEAWERKNHE